MYKTIIWRIDDGKRGHANQTRGLIQAMAELTPVECYDLAVTGRRQNWWWWLTGQFPPGNRLPQPDLIVGAGHGTHIAALAARRAYGGCAIILMRPSIPASLFDLCVIPEHDGPRDAGNVISTRGVLNVIEPCANHQADQGLFLVGGPSATCRWDDRTVLEQIEAIVQNQPEVKWSLTTSRRTPPSFLPYLAALTMSNLTVVPHSQTDPAWLPSQLQRAAQVWVTGDSVSMVYEALTSGAAVGLLAVPGKQTGRVARGMRQLNALGWITRFEQWDRQSHLPPAPAPLHEAARCAQEICQRYRLPIAA